MVELKAAAGVIPGYYFPPPGDQKGDLFVLIAHGNAELASNWFDTAEEMARVGIGALVIEYPGYGNAPGAPSPGEHRGGDGRGLRFHHGAARVGKKESCRARFIGGGGGDL